jgi:hypothetical protein
MSEYELAEIRENLELKPDLELMDILKKGNEDEWQEGVFKVIEGILVKRGLKPPERKPSPAKNDIKQDLTPIDTTNKYYGVRGWLLFFCSLQIIFKPALTVFLWIFSSKQLDKVFRIYPALKTVSFFEIVIGSIVLIYGFSIGIIIFAKKNDAVQATKTFLWVNLAATIFLSLIPFFAGLPSNVQKYFGSQLIRNLAGMLVYFSIWITYFNRSKRVKATFPVSSVQHNKNNG